MIFIVLAFIIEFITKTMLWFEFSYNGGISSYSQIHTAPISAYSCNINIYEDCVIPKMWFLSVKLKFLN